MIFNHFDLLRVGYYYKMKLDNQRIPRILLGISQEFLGNLSYDW